MQVVSHATFKFFCCQESFCLQRISNNAGDVLFVKSVIGI